MMQRFAALSLLAAISFGCGGRPPDGIIESGSVPGRSDPRISHPRVAGYATPEASGVQIWYERIGDPEAPAVVLLNGSDSQAIYWPLDLILEIVEAGYQVVRYDPRDAGLSEWLPFPDSFDPIHWTPDAPPPYELDAHVVDLFGLLDALGIERAHLVGVSQGGMVAQLAALAEPDRVQSLALLSTSPSNPYDEQLGAVDPDLLDYLREQLPRVGRAAALPSLLGGSRVVDLQTDLLARISGVSAEDRPALRDYVEAGYERAGINGASAQGFAVASAPSRLSRLGQITAPTLIIHGTEDRFIQPAHAGALQRAIPGARLIWTPGGHGFPFRMFSSHVDAILENSRRAPAPP
jgi:pimeloyl-ACP methyl ester carboxylesterase